jgi:hypothetical protein
MAGREVTLGTSGSAQDKRRQVRDGMESSHFIRAVPAAVTTIHFNNPGFVEDLIELLRGSD